MSDGVHDPGRDDTGILGVFNFAPGDPPIVMSRRLAVQLLDRMEMARDHTEHVTGPGTDAAGRRLIDELTALLSAPERGVEVLLLNDDDDQLMKWLGRTPDEDGIIRLAITDRQLRMLADDLPTDE
jgi:hypothetical protein